MNAPNRFLRNAELRALDDRHDQLARARSLDELPHRPAHSAELGPAAALSHRITQGRTPPPSVRLAVLRASREGLTSLELSERFGCSERTIHRHLKGTR